VFQFEDVKELYWYLDSTPTHSFASAMYRYPLKAFPYQELIDENGSRGYSEPEYELSDTGILDNNEFVDIKVQYAKATENDVLIAIEVHNPSNHTANISLVPQFWFRNTWAWGYPEGPRSDTPVHPNISRTSSNSAVALHPSLGDYHLYWQGNGEPMFTENETNHERFGDNPNLSPYVKDAFHRYVVNGEKTAINPKERGTKFGLHYDLSITAGGTRTVQLRFSEREHNAPFNGFRPILNKRQSQADSFYKIVQADVQSTHAKSVQRQHETNSGST